MESIKVVVLAPKGTEGASIFLPEVSGTALQAGIADSKSPGDPYSQVHSGMGLVSNATAVSEGVSSRLDAGQILEEVNEVIERLRKLLIAYRLQFPGRSNAVSVESVQSCGLDKLTESVGFGHRQTGS